MKTEFVFDKKTGTMQPVSNATPQLKPMQPQEQRPTPQPQFNNEKTVNSCNWPFFCYFCAI